MISILLVDHALENPRSIRNLFSAANTDFKLSYATSYRDILEGFRSKTFDVCLIDSAVDNGLRLYAQSRSLGCTAPTVIVTSGDAREAINAIRSGVADCLIRDELTAAGIEHSICCVVEQARALLLQNLRERRYLALLDNAKAIVYTHDPQGNFTSINRTGELLTGFSQAELLQMSVWQLVAAEYRNLMEDMLARTLDAQTQTANEIELLTRFGGSLTVEVNTHPINHEGKTIEIQTVAIPRSMQAKNELWESDSVIKEDPDSLAVNEREARLFHIDSRPNNFLHQKSGPPDGRSILIF